LSPYEMNDAIGEVAKSAVQTVFQAADTDRNNTLSMDEYDNALKEPAHAVFRILDANADNQLSLDELQRAEQILADQIARLRVPEPANSLSHQLQGTRKSYRPATLNNQGGASAVPAPAPGPGSR
jgi:EF hand